MEMLSAIQEQIIRLCDPQKILLFGSQAKGTATAKSDIDLCIIAATRDKRALLTALYCDTESDIPIDFLLYTPELYALYEDGRELFTFTWYAGNYFLL